MATLVVIHAIGCLAAAVHLCRGDFDDWPLADRAPAILLWPCYLVAGLMVGCLYGPDTRGAAAGTLGRPDERRCPPID